MIKGIDVSEYQKTIQWNNLSRDFSFAMLRLTEWRLNKGGNRLDDYIISNIQGADQAGVRVGGYVRANPTVNSPEVEVSLFLARLEMLYLLSPGNLVPAIDIEPTGDAADAKVNWPEWTREFIKIWNQRTNNARLQYYTSGSYYDSKYGGLVDIPLNVTLWVGHTNEWNPKLPPMEPTKTTYTFNGRTLLHQYSHEGDLEGIVGAVDLNALMPYASMRDLTIAA